VPADARADPVTDHERLLEGFRRDAREARREAAQRSQEFRDGRRYVHARVVEVVAPAERHGFPLAFPALELKGLERQRSGLLEQLQLHRRRDEFIAVFEPWRRAGEQRLLPG
jgi:hypothetical protein